MEVSGTVLALADETRKDHEKCMSAISNTKQVCKARLSYELT